MIGVLLSSVMAAASEVAANVDHNSDRKVEIAFHEPETGMRRFIPDLLTCLILFEAFLFAAPIAALLYFVIELTFKSHGI